MKDRKRTLEGLLIAMEIDKEGYKFYTSMASIVKDARGAAMFDQIARDELDHLSTLQSEYDSLQNNRDWVPYERAVLSQELKERFEEQVFLDKDELKAKMEQNPNDLDALKIAINIEENAVRFFEEETNRIEEPEGKLLYKKLIEFEEGHLKILRAEYDSITKSGFWLDIQGFFAE